MLKVTRHSSAVSFLERAEAWLMRSEAENNLILGFIQAWARDPAFFKSPPYLATADRDGAVLACAFRSPPHKLVLTRAGHPEAMPGLAADALSVYPDLSTALGPEPDIDAFAAAWGGLSGRRVKRSRRSRIHEARAARRPAGPPSGRLRPATPADLDVLVPWASAMFEEIGERHLNDPAKVSRARIRDGALFVWDDGAPASMAAWSGKTGNGVRVNHVYTPRELRSRGYASACVSALTELLLARGNSFCCLYTDLANPISNRLYERIGYRPVCDVSDYTA
jgi:GNAT superfamily N-acetyltransferase